MFATLRYVSNLSTYGEQCGAWGPRSKAPCTMTVSAGQGSEFLLKCESYCEHCPYHDKN